MFYRIWGTLSFLGQFHMVCIIIVLIIVVVITDSSILVMVELEIVFALV
jgi:hypothetical protein